MYGEYKKEEEEKEKEEEEEEEEEEKEEEEMEEEEVMEEEEEEEKEEEDKKKEGKEKEEEKEEEEEEDEEEEQEEESYIETEKENEVEKECEQMEKCKYCNVESLSKNLCIECNYNKNYFFINTIKNNFNSIQDKYIDCANDITKPPNFYFNKENNDYEPCFYTCAACKYGGDGNENNCSSCESNFIFKPDYINSKNCVKKCIIIIFIIY